MWIRSQDKKRLAKVTSVHIYEELDGMFMLKGLNECCVGYQDDDYFNLGEYETEERALEVLNEIQNEISELSDIPYSVEPITAIGIFLAEMVRIERAVYQMPKE